MYKFDYLSALYRRDNNGAPCVWYAKAITPTWIECTYGILGKSLTTVTTTSSRDAQAEIETKINEKRKKGYKYLSELRDDTTLPVEGALMDYLKAYLPYNRTASDGNLLPMLAKTFDNENNKVFKKVSSYYGQWKINGLRCFVKFYRSSDGIFEETRIDFQSREGEHWTKLGDLEQYLLNAIPKDVQDKIIDNGWILDGEVYLPGYTVNDINHFVKDGNSFGNKLIQLWVYDIAIEDCIQSARFEILNEILGQYCVAPYSKEEHLSNNSRLVVLPLFNILNEEDAIFYRDMFIGFGYEGLIMRNPNAEYQFGSRKVNTMYKFKKATDGKFLIVDIKPEGAKRPDIPLFVCKNDISDAYFECHVGGSLDYQRSILADKYKYIGKYMHVEFGERSGIEQVPFHVKTTYIIK